MIFVSEKEKGKMDLLMIRGYESNVEPHEFRPGGSSGKHKRRWIRSRVVINGVELLTARSILGVQPLLKRNAAKQ
jgi:hypothetical protein